MIQRNPQAIHRLGILLKATLRIDRKNELQDCSSVFLSANRSISSLSRAVFLLQAACPIHIRAIRLARPFCRHPQRESSCPAAGTKECRTRQRCGILLPAEQLIRGCFCTAVHRRHRHGNPVPLCPFQRHSMPPDGKYHRRAHCAYSPGCAAWSRGSAGRRRYVHS